MDPYICVYKNGMLQLRMEASGSLVAPAVFKTDVAGSSGQAGSIPVRLRDCDARQAVMASSCLPPARRSWRAAWLHVATLSTPAALVRCRRPGR